jgi:tripartite-type tricarboxylate transporter receptor subunit TctC
MRRSSTSALVSMLVVCATAWSQAAASLYPSKSVLLIDAQAAGGPADREARLYAKKMSDKLNEAFVRAAKEPDVAGALESEGSIMIGSTPAQFRQFLVTDTNRNRKLMQDNGLKLNE